VDWALFLAIATGVLMGSLFRVSALIISCGLLLVLVIVAGLVAEFSAARLVFRTLVLLCTHQAGYVAGLLMHQIWRRLKWRRGIGRAEHS
jgi:cytochrome c oxidase subunit IV